MREIKFRARPCYMGGKQPSWVYGTFQYIGQHRINQGSTDNGMLEPRADKGRIVNIYGVETEVLCDTLGQFTGLYDKNGKEIYEGDIVYSEFKDGSHTNGLIGWDDETASFGLMDEYSYRSKLQGYDFPKFEFAVLCNFRRHGEKFEVVGNIHDNPELLNGTP